MHPLLRTVNQDREILLAAAAPVEIAAIARSLGASAVVSPHVPAIWERVTLRPGIDLVHLGVGKANAAAGLAQALRPTDGLVLNVGIAGSLPDAAGEFGLRPSDCIAASACVFADEGLLTDAGFADVGSIGFPIDSVLGSRFPCDQRVVEAFSPAAKHVGPIATVSTCSATDNSAREVARRTGALAETMEGAACALVAHRRGIPFAEVRAISNYTGARANQRWDIQSALEALDHVLRRVLD